MQKQNHLWKLGDFFLLIEGLIWESRYFDCLIFFFLIMLQNAECMASICLSQVGVLLFHKLLRYNIYEARTYLPCRKNIVTHKKWPFYDRQFLFFLFCRLPKYSKNKVQTVKLRNELWQKEMSLEQSVKPIGLEN